jgi:hypothetical protein
MLSSVRKYVKPKSISRQNQKLTQQNNWKKSSSSPHEASVYDIYLRVLTLDGLAVIFPTVGFTKKEYFIHILIPT